MMVRIRAAWEAYPASVTWTSAVCALAVTLRVLIVTHWG